MRRRKEKNKKERKKEKKKERVTKGYKKIIRAKALKRMNSYEKKIKKIKMLFTCGNFKTFLYQKFTFCRNVTETYSFQIPLGTGKVKSRK